MRTIDDKVSKVCLDEIIVICVCVTVLLFPLFNLPAILAFDVSRRNPLTYEDVLQNALLSVPWHGWNMAIVGCLWAYEIGRSNVNHPHLGLLSLLLLWLKRALLAWHMSSDIFGPPRILAII